MIAVITSPQPRRITRELLNAMSPLSRELIIALSHHDIYEIVEEEKR